MYRIQTATGDMSRREQNASYNTFAAAQAALEVHQGWSQSFASEWYAMDDGDTVSVYETTAQRDEDEEGAHAPRIVKASA